MGPHQQALLRARLKYTFKRRPRRLVLRRLRKTFGNSVSPQERRRLARAAFFYRELAREDVRNLSLLSFDEPGQQAFGESSSFRLVLPRTPFDAAMDHWIAGRLEGGGTWWSAAAPLAHSSSRRDIDEFAGRAREDDSPVFAAGFLRAGVHRFVAGPVRRLDEGSPSPQELAGRIGTFLDDWLRAYPAQYDWFGERP